MELTIDITLKGAVTAWGRRAVNDVMRRAFEKAGIYWGQKFLPKHFTMAGAREYGYAPRKGERARPGTKQFSRYAGPEEKRRGKIIPLVYAGNMEDTIRTYNVRAAATSKDVYVKVTVPGARGMNRLPANMRGDLRRVSDAEWAAITKVINAEIQVGLAALQGTEQKRIG